MQTKLHDTVGRVQFVVFEKIYEFTNLFSSLVDFTLWHSSLVRPLAFALLPE